MGSMGKYWRRCGGCEEVSEVCERKCWEVWGRCQVSVGEGYDGGEGREVVRGVERCEVSVEKCGETC